MTPAAAWTFWARISRTTSPADSPCSATFCGSSQIAHRIVAGAEELDLSDAVDPGEPVLDVEHRVVAQIGHVVAAVRRGEMHHHRQVGRALDRGDAERRTSSGRRGSAWLTRFCTSCWALSGSVPKRKVTFSVMTPSVVAWLDM
jgi:secreted trypsin-like serine protease